MKAKKVRTAVVMPSNLNEVDANIGEIGTIDRIISLEKASLEARFERLRAQSRERLQEVIAKRNGLMKGIAKFAKKNRTSILPPDRKSIELASGTFGWRLDPWKVILTGKEETVIAWLETEKMPRFLRRKVELNRDQLLEERGKLVKIPGVSFDQNERFFVEPKEEKVREGTTSVVSLVRVA